MFRFTIYSIVLYASWLTFVDISDFMEQDSGNIFIEAAKGIWQENSGIVSHQSRSQTGSQEQLTTQHTSYSAKLTHSPTSGSFNCENQSCYSQETIRAQAMLAE